MSTYYKSSKQEFSFFPVVWVLGMMIFLPYSSGGGMYREANRWEIRAQEFHANLCNAHPEWFQEGVRAYYKTINSHVPEFQREANQWSFTVAGQPIGRGADRIYRMRDRNQEISFTIPPVTNFDQDPELIISLTRGGVSNEVRCIKVVDQKELVLTGLNSYRELLNNAQQNKIWWVRKVTFEGTLHRRDEEPCIIKIEGMSRRKNPISVNGMEISYREDQEKTNIFFDLADSSGRSLDYFIPIFTCDHRKFGDDKKVYRIINHQLYECNAKDITYQIFDSLENHNRWVLDEARFYDQNRQEITSLRSSYSDVNNRETPVEPMTWVLEEGLNSLYEFNNAPHLMDTNDYLYSAGDGSLFVTLPYNAVFKEYLSQSNMVNVHYLEKVEKPSLEVYAEAPILGGHRNWSEGFYKRTRFEDRIIWKKVGTEEVQDHSIIQFFNQALHEQRLSGGAFFTKWPAREEALTAEENIRWGNAAQRFFRGFGSEIFHCDRALLNELGGWRNLISLNLSRLKLGERVEWRDVLEGLGSMSQLTQLHFDNNSPVVDFKENYQQLADRASSYYQALGACLGRLQNLRELHLQGLWLKPHTMLEDRRADQISHQVAILTGIINHHNGQGVKDIIHNICQLSRLAILSIDGIPDRGSSVLRRSAGFLSTLPWILVSIPLSPLIASAFWREGNQQSKNLKALAAASADRLSGIATAPARPFELLTTLKIYAPAGRYFDYFSKFFRERIAHARSDLRVVPSVLSDN